MRNFPFYKYFDIGFAAKHNDILTEKLYTAKVTLMEKTEAKFRADAELESITKYLASLQQLMNEATNETKNKPSDASVAWPKLQ